MAGAQALRVLDNVMDTVIDQPVNPPPAWELLERCGPPGHAPSHCHGSTRCTWCTWPIIY